MIYYNMIMKVKIPKTQSNNQIIESYWELIDMKIIIMMFLGLSLKYNYFLISKINK